MCVCFILVKFRVLGFPGQWQSYGRPSPLTTPVTCEGSIWVSAQNRNLPDSFNQGEPACTWQNTLFRRQSPLNISCFLTLEMAFYPVDLVGGRKKGPYFVQSLDLNKCQTCNEIFPTKDMGAINRDFFSFFLVGSIFKMVKIKYGDFSLPWELCSFMILKLDLVLYAAALENLYALYLLNYYLLSAVSSFGFHCASQTFLLNRRCEQSVLHLLFGLFPYSPFIELILTYDSSCHWIQNQC